MKIIDNQLSKEIELKNIKMQKGHDDSHSFTASLYVDGKRMCSVSDDGWGGGVSFGTFIENSEGVINGLLKEAKEIKFIICKSEISLNWDIIIGDLINQYLMQKQVKAALKKVSYFEKEKYGSIFQMPARVKPTKENFEAIKQEKWWKPDDYILLNEMDFDKAVDLYKTYMSPKNYVA